MEISRRFFSCPRKEHYYNARIIKDLMGDTVVKFEWGGAIKTGGTKTILTDSLFQAVDIVDELAKKITKPHRGYYEVFNN